MILGEVGLKTIEDRGINVETAARYGLYTARWDKEKRLPVPDAKGIILAFPFMEHGVEVNTKFRAEPKRFFQTTGGRKTFWNADVLDDPALSRDEHPEALVITEGEFDALAAIDSGFPYTVSVPDGAPTPSSSERSIDDDRAGKFEFVWNNRDRLKRVKHFILAVDSDAPGQKLAEELVRRFGAVRCSFVMYPSGCKDLNDVLLEEGAAGVARVIKGAKPYPVKGIYRLSDYPPVQELQVFSTGWWTVDEHFKMFPGELIVVSGVPSHGKTQWVLNLAVNAARLHGWPIGIFSPEMPTAPQLRDALRRIVAGGERDWDKADEFIQAKFTFLDVDPAEPDEDEDKTIDWLMEKGGDAVLRDGIRMLIVDPWNEVEHAKPPGEPMTDYIGRSLRRAKRFGKRFGVATVIIAHPTKIETDKSGKLRTVALYDIEGSAHWYNKCDHGIVIERNLDNNETKIHVAKSRFANAGTRGTATMKFDPSSGRFLLLNEDGKSPAAMEAFV